MTNEKQRSLHLQKRGEVWEIVEKIGKVRGKRVFINLPQNEAEKSFILSNLCELFENNTSLLKRHKEHNKAILLAQKEAASVEKCVAMWLSEAKSANLRFNTLKTYQSQGEALLSFFKAQNIETIDEINKQTAQDLLNFLKEQKGNKPSQIAKILSTLNQVLNCAVENGIINANLYKRPRGFKKEQREPTPLKWQSAKTLMQNANGILKLYLNLAFYTGARESEILALKWGDIDLNAEELNINKILLENGEIQNECKTKSSKRIVQIIAPLKSFLKDFKEIESNKSSYIFTNEKGKFLGAEKMRDLWRELLNANENLESTIKEARLYDTRATFASNCLANGEPVLWVSKMLGHANPSITYKHYARYIKETKHQIGAWVKGF